MKNKNEQKNVTQSDLFDMEWFLEDEKKETQIDATFLFQELERELGEYLLDQQLEWDSTDGAISFIENLTNRIQEEFDETIGEDGEEKNIS